MFFFLVISCIASHEQAKRQTMCIFQNPLSKSLFLPKSQANFCSEALNTLPANTHTHTHTHTHAHKHTFITKLLVFANKFGEAHKHTLTHLTPPSLFLHMPHSSQAFIATVVWGHGFCSDSMFCASRDTKKKNTANTWCYNTHTHTHTMLATFSIILPRFKN